jgi:hypothetical protein
MKKAAIPSPSYQLLSAVSVARETDNDLTEPWQWGTPIEFDEAGRASGFELNLVDSIIYTFVRWADSEDDRDRGRDLQK